MLFTPAIVLMNRLDITRKFLLLGLMLLIAIFVVVYSLYLNLDLVIQKSQQELNGLALIKPFTNSIQHLQQHRGLSSALLNGDKTMDVKLANSTQINAAALMDLEQKLPADISSRTKFQKIKDHWSHIQIHGLKWSKDENFAAHTQLINELRLLEMETADKYSLTSDPETGTHYLLISAIQIVPNLIERLGRIRGFGSGILAHQHATELERVEIKALIDQLGDVLDDLRDDLEKVGNQNPELRKSILSIDKNIFDSSLLISNAAVSDIIIERSSMRPGDFYDLATVAINKGYAQLYDSLLPMSEELINTRIQNAKNELRMSIGIAFLLFFVAAYFAVGICYSIIQNIKLLAHSAHSFANGNIQERVHINTRDELRSVFDSFNEVADGFSKLLEARNEVDARLRGTLETALDAVVLMDSKGIIIGWNDPAEKTFGWPKEEVLGRVLSETIIPHQYREAHTEGLKRFLQSGVGPALNTRIEIFALHRDGHEFPVELSIAPIVTAGQYEFSAFIRDITQRKTAEEQTKHYVEQLEKAFMRTVGVATSLTEMRDPYTAGHERRVSEIAGAIGEEMGLDARKIEGLRVAGLLHDIGKIALPAEILAKPGRITPAEFTLIQGHAQGGYDALKDVGFPWPVAEVAWQHHERMDGSGYPRGLKGDEILLEARIMSVADVVEAMAAHRPYRPGHGIEKALAEIEKGGGSSFDIEVVNACLRIFREKGYTLPV